MNRRVDNLSSGSAVSADDDLSSGSAVSADDDGRDARPTDQTPACSAAGSGRGPGAAPRLGTVRLCAPEVPALDFRSRRAGIPGGTCGATSGATSGGASGGNFRGRGSVMVLVIVIIVLMALVGTAYVQMMRVDRIAARQVTHGYLSQRHIDDVVVATVDQLKQTLKDDLFNENNDILNPDVAVGVSAPLPLTPGSVARVTNAGDEGYDYPWTNATDTGTTGYDYAFPVTLSYGTATTDAVGGWLDDMWLASSQPDFSSTNVMDWNWPHITNLNGIFIDIPLPRPDDTTVPPHPAEEVIDFTTPVTPTSTDIDTDVRLLTILHGNLSSKYDHRGYDADGDGILDSRWTWAPIRHIDGVDYIMAVRIIDNSAMINVNTATAQTNDGNVTFGTYANTNFTIGAWPTSADLSRLLARTRMVYPNPSWREIMGRLMLYRAGQDIDGSPNPLPAAPGLQRARLFIKPNLPSFASLANSLIYFKDSPAGDYWGRVIRYGYAQFDQEGDDQASNLPPADKWHTFGPDDEVSLRFGNGLSSSRFAPTSLEKVMRLRNDNSDLLRGGNPLGSIAVNETHFSDPPLSLAATDLNSWRWFFEGNDPGTGLVEDRVFPEIRKWLTTCSGAAELLPSTYGPTQPMTKFAIAPHDGMIGSAGLADTAGALAAHIPPAMTTAKLTALREAIGGVLGVGGATDGYLAGILSVIQRNDLAGAFAACIADYIDADSTPTLYSWGMGPNQDYYGLERLPFIREVYVQAGYQSTFHPNPIDPTLPGFYSWEFVNTSPAIAVELGNPFDGPIDPADLAGNVQITFDWGGVPVSWDFVTDVVLAGPIPAHGVMIVYLNPPNGLNETGTMLGANLATSLNLTGHVDAQGNPIEAVQTATAVPIAAGANLQVRLEVNVGGWKAYDRFPIAPNTISLSQTIPNSDPTISGVVYRHYQVAVGRACQLGGSSGIYYVSNNGAGNVGPVRSPSTLGYVGGAAYDLGGDTKGGLTGSLALQHFQLCVANRPILNPAELAWIHMFGFNVTATGDFPQLMDAAISQGLDPDTNAPRTSFLDFSPAAVIPPQGAGVPPGTGIPHAAMLMDLISTISPQNDGIDNDNADHDDDMSTLTDAKTTGTGNDRTELFVPGTINVNTAPLHVLTLAAPLPEVLGDTQALMTRVIQYRDNVVTGGTPWREANLPLTNIGNLRKEPGIASIGELMLVDNPAWTNPPDRMKRYIDPSQGGSQGNTEIDLYPLYLDPTALPPAAGPGDDAEERIARFQFLNQVLSVRSDVYTAYVEIRGYPADDWRRGPVETARFLVVLDRGQITAPNDEVRIVAMYRY